MRVVLLRAVLALLVVSVLMALLKWSFGLHLSWALILSVLLVPIILAAVNLSSIWKRAGK
jgi:hypothetical protein